MEKIRQEIVEVLTRKAGLDAAAAQRAVDAVIDHIRQNPGRIAELMGLGGLGGIFGGGAAPRRQSDGPPPRSNGNADVI